MNIPGQDQIDDPVILDRIRADRQSDLDFVFKSTNPDYPNRKTANIGNGGDLWFRSKRGRNGKAALTPLEEAEKLRFVSDGCDKVRCVTIYT